MKPLIVYKASAGSGKTFTLAVEYIKLLVKNPQAYRQTLAVTFTNKATEEMKLRIMSQLYGIWRALPSSAAYTEVVCRQLDASPAFVQERAGMALRNLLHNYSYFRVETIDSFFQSVLRNLARELDLTANLRVGLNDVQVEEQAVDELIENLSATDVMLSWLLRYIMDNISDDRSWNVIGQVKQFGRNIFRDFYKQQSKQLHQTTSRPGFFEDYTALLKKERARAKQQMAELGKAFLDTLADEGLAVEDLAYGRSGVAGCFLKMCDGVFDESIITKRVADAVGQPDKWCTKKHPRRELIYMLADGQLGQLLRRAIDERPRWWRLYQSADLTLRHLSQLRLLGSIEQKVRQLNEESNRFLLSDTQQLLHELIEGSDSPFIFEKIGTQLEHIMIDEFQDTSTVQWQNFKVLLEETMSHADTENLIVGDVKQSIYRWRSGDWRLLAGIKKEFANADERLDIKPLTFNYRSARNIVQFNNAFFTTAAQTETVAAYDDVVQQVPPHKEPQGQVVVRLQPSADYQTATLQALVEQVQTLISQGIPSDQIAILVRTNAYIPLIANFFMEHLPTVKVVSDEAFRLDASPAVMAIIQAMRLLALGRRSDDTHTDRIAEAYLAKILHRDQPLHLLPASEWLPEAFSKHTDELRRLPLYELTERLYDIFKLSLMDGQSAYLCAFYDCVASGANENPTDITTFLHEWDQALCSKTIQSPDLKGIRLISIHKSKGLEYPHVLIPFCDWRMEHNDILWCQPKEKPFSELPLAPIDYSEKGMRGTIYEAEYEEEHQQNVVDNLNLLYVAFTRAECNLFVWGKRGAKASRSGLLETVLPQLTETLPESQLEGLEDEQAELTFSYGTMAFRQEKSQHDDGNVFLRKPTAIDVGIEVCQKKAEFRQSNDSMKFAQPAEEQSEQQANYIQLGNVLHGVFSSIRTVDDVDNALQQLELDGIIYDKHITKDRLESMIRKRLADPRVRQWFASDTDHAADGASWRLFNECTILLPSGEERRPDRVMTNDRQMVVVDFKFGKERDAYHEQVRQYMNLLAQMGYQNISGYLWYVYSNKIVEVK